MTRPARTFFAILILPLFFATELLAAIPAPASEPRTIPAQGGSAEAAVQYEQEFQSLLDRQDNEPNEEITEEVAEDLDGDDTGELEDIDPTESLSVLAATSRMALDPYKASKIDTDAIKSLPDFKIVGKNKAGNIFTVEKYKNAAGETVLNFTRDCGRYVICLNVDSGVIVLKYADKSDTNQTLYLTEQDAPTNYYKSLAGAKKILNKLIAGNFRIRGDVRKPLQKLREVKKSVIRRLVEISTGSDFVVAKFDAFGKPFPVTRSIVTRNNGTLWFVKRKNPDNKNVQRQYIFHSKTNPPFVDIEDRWPDGTTETIRVTAASDPREYFAALNDIQSIAGFLLRREAIGGAPKRRVRDFIDGVIAVKRRDRHYLRD